MSQKEPTPPPARVMGRPPSNLNMEIRFTDPEIKAEAVRVAKLNNVTIAQVLGTVLRTINIEKQYKKGAIL